jgi:hypothetical protein
MNSLVISSLYLSIGSHEKLTSTFHALRHNAYKLGNLSPTPRASLTSLLNFVVTRDSPCLESPAEDADECNVLPVVSQKRDESWTESLDPARCKNTYYGSQYRPIDVFLTSSIPYYPAVQQECETLLCAMI